MTVAMSFASVNGLYEFNAEEMPLFGRRLDYQRQQEQGYGNRRVSCNLAGFFDRRNHKDMMTAYQALLHVIKANDCEFVYRIDTADIIRKRVYMANYTEPSDWKEFQGDYSIEFYYFEQPNFSVADLGIAASYTSPTGNYVFKQTPLWSAGSRSTRSSWRSSMFTPSGQPISTEATITLTGQLTADDYPGLKAEVDLLSAAFQSDGTLNYGSWTNIVRVESLEIPAVFPREFCFYTIVLKYDLADIYEFEATATFSRIHKFPKIKEYPFCNFRSVRQFNDSGQTVNYFISVTGANVAAARTLLANEAFNLVAGGGIEMEGGNEVWDYVKNKVSLSISKFHEQPVVPNLPGT